MAAYWILSSDRGGWWALIQAMVLQALCSEDATGRGVPKDFYLAAANSGGSVTPGDRVEDPGSKTLFAFDFLDEAKRHQVFSPVSVGENIENGVEKLLGVAPQPPQALLPNFGPVPLATMPARASHSAGECPDLLICRFNYETRRAAFFLSNLKSNAASFAPPVPATVADATNVRRTASVNFFDEPAEISESRYWDGAIVAYNNPMLAAITDRGY